ncbi:MAG: toll/interleukin-1 receptor domain-containing protein [Candidatus Nitrosopolaris sp.]
MTGTSSRRLRVIKKIWSLSYAREDFDVAMRLYNESKNAGLNGWLDKYKMLPDQNWGYKIQDALEHGRYIIPLFSSTSILPLCVQ